MKPDKKRVAVGLRYDYREEAPLITAKGEGRVAEWILERAREFGIPTLKNPAVARTLYEAPCDVGEMIPPEIYELVAQILAFVYSQNDGGKRRGWDSNPHGS